MASASLSGLSSKGAPGLLTHEVSSFWNGVAGGVMRGTWQAATPSSHMPSIPYTEPRAGQRRHLQLHEDVPSWARSRQEAS